MGLQAHLAFVVLASACGRLGFNDLAADPTGGSVPDAASAAIAAPMQGLIAFWSLDQFSAGQASDVEGGNTANCVGPCPPLVAGKFGMAASFDGSSTFCLDVPSMQAWPSTTFTVSAWVSSTNIDGPIVAHESASGCPDPALGARNGLLGLTQLNTTSLHNEAWTNGPIADMTAWHHVAASWDGTTQSVFLDGACSCNVVPAYAPVPNTAQFSIGCYPGANIYFAGAIDQVRVYDRALTPAEVTTLYAEGTTTTPDAITCPALCNATAPPGAP